MTSANGDLHSGEYPPFPPRRLFEIDLAPGPRGVVGRMVWWEIHEGPIPHGADSLLTLLRVHWKHLSSGKYNSPEAWEMAGCWELTKVERT